MGGTHGQKTVIGRSFCRRKKEQRSRWLHIAVVGVGLEARGKD